jgi:bifunctional enzyme Fae/Hps
MRLANPPYLQIALDLVSKDQLVRILNAIPKSDKIILEAGTPLIKKFGIDILKEFLSFFEDTYIVADMKTLDVGKLEVQIAAEEKACAVAISGLASTETIESSIEEGTKSEVDIILDLMNVKNPETLINQLSRKPKIILFHRGIDQEGNKEHPWELIEKTKSSFPDILVAVAGGLDLPTSEKALEKGVDILVIGRAITQSDDIEATTNDFLQILGKDIDT